VNLVKRTAQLTTAALIAVFSTGCVGTIYAVKANAAASKLETAKTLEADELSEFEYWYAHEHMIKAQEQAAEANYGDAINYADIAEEYAEKAIEQARAARRGAGR